MSLKKKILIGIATFALVIAISFGAVFAAQTFTTTSTANVSFDAGDNIQCKAVWCQFIQFNSTGNTGNTFNLTTKVSEKPAQYASLFASDFANTTNWNFGQMEFSSKTNCWLLVFFVEVNGINSVKATISHSPNSVTNLTFGSYQTATLTKTGTAPAYVFSSLSSLTNIANPGSTGVTIAGNAIGEVTHSVCIVQKITISNSVPPLFNSNSITWTVSLTKA